nr:hypothetical protein [uncultured Pedobacter sp.]
MGTSVPAPAFLHKLRRITFFGKPQGIRKAGFEIKLPSALFLAALTFFFLTLTPFKEDKDTVTLVNLASLRDTQPSLTPFGTNFLPDEFTISKSLNDTKIRNSTLFSNTFINITKDNIGMIMNPISNNIKSSTITNAWIINKPVHSFKNQDKNQQKSNLISHFLIASLLHIPYF